MAKVYCCPVCEQTWLRRGYVLKHCLKKHPKQIRTIHNYTVNEEGRCVAYKCVEEVIPELDGAERVEIYKNKEGEVIKKPNNFVFW